MLGNFDVPIQAGDWLNKSQCSIISVNSTDCSKWNCTVTWPSSLVYLSYDNSDSFIFCALCTTRLTKLNLFVPTYFSIHFLLMLLKCNFYANKQCTLVKYLLDKHFLYLTYKHISARCLTVYTKVHLLFFHFQCVPCLFCLLFGWCETIS